MACEGYQSNFDEATTDQKVMIQLGGATTVRPAIVGIMISPKSATAQDYQVHFELRRTATLGTGGNAGNIFPVDTGGPASRCAVRTGLTTNLPTYANPIENLLPLGKPMRVPYNFKFEPGMLVQAPATTGAGFAFQCFNNTTAYNELGQIKWLE